MLLVAQRFRFSGVRFDSYRPSAKLNLPSLPFEQHHHHNTVRDSTLSSSVFNNTHIPFLVLFCNFCQLDTATPFGSRLIHTPLPAIPSTQQLLRQAPPRFQSQLIPTISSPLIQVSTRWHRCENYLPACPAHRSVTFIQTPPRGTRLSRPSASPIYVSRTSPFNGLIIGYFATSQAALDVNDVVFDTLAHCLCHCCGFWGSCISPATTQEHAHPTTEKPETAKSDARTTPYTRRGIHQKPNTYGYRPGTYRARYQHDREVCPNMVPE